MYELKFKLSGLHCESCTSSVSKTLSRISEITDLKVAINEAIITVNENKPEIASKVISKVKRLGYKAELILQLK